MLEKIRHFFRNPICFLFLLLLPFNLYFTDFHLWWIIQCLIQLFFCFIGFYVSSWRTVAIISTALLLYFNLSWFLPFRTIPEVCSEQIDHFSGISKTDVLKIHDNLNLSKVEIWCKGKSVYWASATIEVKKKIKKWFQAGDRIEISNVDIKKVNQWQLSVTTKGKGFKVYNLSKQKRILNRSRILVHIQSKARFYLDGFPLAIFKALMTADRSDLNKNWRTRIQHLGIMHIFAISGMHIGIIYLWISGFLRLLIANPMSWVEKGYGILLVDITSLILIFGFLTIIGMPISAKRSLMMLTWWVIVKHFLPWQPPWFILMGVAILILLEQPHAMGQISFQLSFMSVAGIILIMPFLPQRRYQDSTWIRFLKPVISIMMISFWLFIFTFPLVQQLSPYHSLISVINNVIHISFLTFILLPIFLVVFVYSLIGYFCHGLPGEIYFYSVINIISRIWEKLLIWNDKMNTQWLWRSEWKLNGYFIVFYWIIVSIVPIIMFQYKNRRNKV